MSADARGVPGPAGLRIAHILRATPEVELDLRAHGREILDTGFNGLPLLTGPREALEAPRPGMNLRGTHAPVTDEEIAASLRPASLRPVAA